MTERDRLLQIRGLVETQLPHYPVTSVVRLGEGLDSLAYAVNRELIVRLSRDPDPVRLNDEVRLLAAVSTISPLPVPEPVFSVAELGCMAYFRLPGVPLLDRPRDEWPAHSRAVAATLGELLRALHGADVERMAELVPTDDCSLSERLQEAARDYASVAGQVPVAYRRSVEAFLTARPPADGRALVFSHNDLGIEHVLVDPRSWMVTGIIDWSDAAIVDPAHDVGLIYRDLGPEAAEIAVRSCGTDQEDDAAFGERVVFHARCGVIEDLAYGISIDRGAYVEKSLAALDWLFAR